MAPFPPRSLSLGALPCEKASLGPWQIVGDLATGSDTVVRRAVDGAGRRVALKAPRSGDVTASVRHRLTHEAASLRRAATMGVVGLVEDASGESTPYLALELLEGPTLGRLVERLGALRASQVQTIGALLADILDRVHHHGLLHGDLKPANVVCVHGGPVLIDFDAACSVADDSTRELVWRGSPWWLAPEQVLAGPLGPFVDVFALGSLLAYLCTGRPAFGAGHPAAVLYRVVHEAPDLSGVPFPLRGVVACCLDKDPRRRPSARWVAEHLIVSRQATLCAA